MKKRIYFLLLCLYFLCISSFSIAFSKTVYVKSLSEFSSNRANETYAIQFLEDTTLDKYNTLEAGTVVAGNLLRVVEPKRLQRDAYFVFMPKMFSIPNGKWHKVYLQKESKIKYYEEYEVPGKKEIAQNVGITAAGMMVPGLDYAIQFSQGVADPKDDETRLHSGARKIVEGWPFCYFLKGEEVTIQKGATAKFTFDKNIFRP